MTSDAEAPRSIPFSRFAPVVLERPLRLFGRTFQIHISSALTFAPVTVLEVATGLTPLQFIRTYAGERHAALRDLWRGMTRTNRLTSTTRSKVVRQFSPIISSEVLDAVMEGRAPPLEEPSDSDWQVLHQIIQSPPDDDLSRLVAFLAEFDCTVRAAQAAARDKRTEDAIALVGPLVRSAWDGWKTLKLPISASVALLVDVSLLAWAHEEARAGGNQTFEPLSLSALLARGRKPIGHWLLHVQRAAQCKNFQELTSIMSQKGLKRHGRLIGHDLLKKWSSGVQLMPRQACMPLIEAAAGRVDVGQESRRFALARWASFLCDLTCAATVGARLRWPDAQEQLAQRYRTLRCSIQMCS